MKTKIISLILILLIIITGCSNENNLPNVNLENKNSCFQDSDCVPDSCCHANSCVLKENAPDCSDTFCTEECKPGTMDCGGHCSCIEGECITTIKRN